MSHLLRILTLTSLLLFSTYIAAENSVKVVMETSIGNMTLELDAHKAPVTVKNFLDYVDSEHYHGTIFHRVIKNFMIQGGGYDKGYKKKPTNAPIINEASNGLKNLRGTIAMARTSDPHSATSQFFINHKDNTPLDYTDNNAGYAVFGRVIEGLDVVDAIASVTTGDGGPFSRDVPKEQVEIISIKRAN